MGTVLTMKKISVAMAVYNGEPFLAEQLDSILSQLQESDEVIVSYDTSTDNTWGLLTAYAEKHPQIKIFTNPHPGIAGNFDNAIRNCTGDYIFICDQDDRWAEQKRDTLVNAFEQTQADMIIHNGVHIDADGRVISQPFFSLYRIGDGKIRNFIKPRYSGCCTAFTQAMAQKILPIPYDIDAYDHWIGTVGECMGRIAYEESILLYHRLHDSNVTPTSKRSPWVILRARLRLLRELHTRRKRERIKE